MRNYIRTLVHAHFAAYRSSFSSVKHSTPVYTVKGNLPGYTGHVPSEWASHVGMVTVLCNATGVCVCVNTTDSTDYHGLTFGDVTRGFGKQHQDKVKDELVKDLRVRMPG